MIELDLTNLGNLKKQFTKVCIHPAAEFAPALTGKRFDRFFELFQRTADVDEVDPIVAVRIPESDGHVNGSVAVISGRTRLEAHRRLGTEPRVKVYEGPLSPAELAATLNLFHNHPTTGQLAAIGVEYEDLIAVEARKRQSDAGVARHSKEAKTAIGDQNQLLTKLSKAVGANNSTNPEAAKTVDGKTWNQTWSSLMQQPRKALEARFARIFPNKIPFLRDESNVSMVNAIINSLFEEEKPTADAPLHARKIVAETLEISEGYLNQARRVREFDPKMFEQLKRRELKLTDAFSQVRRSAKRGAQSSNLPMQKPFDNSAMTGIRIGDCNKHIPTLPRRRMKLIFADPPYNIGINYGDGEKADRIPDAQYLSIHERWIKQLPELLTPDGSVWVCINDEYAAEFVMTLKRTGLKMRGWIKWYETFGTNCTNKFNRTSRHLLYFVRDEKRIVFNAEAFNTPSARQLKYGDKRAAPGGKIWDDVWIIPRLTGTCAERIEGVPTQLPLALVQPIVEGCSNPGDLVFDPFCGSGTTAVAAKLTGRDCLTIEQNAGFAQLASARVESTRTMAVYTEVFQRSLGDRRVAQRGATKC